MKNTYYCRLRPPTLGAVPKMGLIEINTNEITINNRDYWGAVTYNRELTKEELFNYDLDEIITYTKEELQQKYHDFLYNLFEADEDRILQYINDEEAYNNFLTMI